MMKYMKKWIALSILVLVLFSILLRLQNPIMAEEGLVNSLSLSVEINGETLVFPDAKPFIDEASRMLVPVRVIAENMGAIVNWDSSNYTVKISRGSKEISLKIGEKVAQIYDNGSLSMVEFDTKAVIVEDRTFIPIRFVSEIFGAKIDWDGEIRIARIVLQKLGEGVTPMPLPSPSVAISQNLTQTPTPTPMPSPSLKPVSSNFDFDEHPLISQLAKIKWLGLGQKLEDGTYTLYFYRPWDNNEVMQLMYVPSTNMFAVDMYWASEETLKMAREALLIARPEIAEQVFELIRERIGGKGRFTFEYIGVYSVSIVPVSAFGYPRDEQGVMTVIRGGY